MSVTVTAPVRLGNQSDLTDDDGGGSQVECRRILRPADSLKASFLTGAVSVQDGRLNVAINSQISWRARRASGRASAKTWS